MPWVRTIRQILLVPIALVGIANAQDEVANSTNRLIAPAELTSAVTSSAVADHAKPKPPHQFVKWSDGLILEAEDGSVRAHLGALIQQDWTAFGQSNSLTSDSKNR